MKKFWIKLRMDFTFNNTGHLTGCEKKKLKMLRQFKAILCKE